MSRKGKKKTFTGSGGVKKKDLEKMLLYKARTSFATVFSLQKSLKKIFWY